MFLPNSEKNIKFLSRLQSVAGENSHHNCSLLLNKYWDSLTRYYSLRLMQCEVELQIKKAEAAQTRRTQVEKAARESEAEAIKKILGQDSSRKKREDKIKKQQ